MYQKFSKHIPGGTSGSPSERDGDLSILSFHATKVFNTFEGGAIVCHDKKTKQRLDHLKNFGFVDEVTVVAPGINGKMSEFNSALGLLQLTKVDEEIRKRRYIASRYRDQLASVTGVVCLADDNDYATNYSYFPVLITPDYPITRDDLYHRLRQHRIHARRYFYPLISEFPMYRGLPSASHENLAVAKKSSDQIICLPIYSVLEQSDQDSVISIP